MAKNPLVKKIIPFVFRSWISVLKCSIDGDQQINAYDLILLEYDKDTEVNLIEEA